MRGHSMKMVLGNGLPNFKCAKSVISVISHEGWKERHASGPVAPGGWMSKLAAGRKPGPPYPASEFSYTGFSSAGVCCFPSCQNCSIKGTH
jgi:hypothetical protein